MEENQQSETPKTTRKRLFSSLNSVLETAEKKFQNQKTRNHEKLKWGRLICQCVQTYGSLLETVQLEELENEIEEIKKQVGMKP
jgi:hypothetical protein